MSGNTARIKLRKDNIIICKSDLPSEYIKLIKKNKIVAWDIETSSLDWKRGNIGLCQLFTPPDQVVIIKIDESVPNNLSLLLSENSIKKVFHHAMFDLRFMSYHWKITPKNIACTKIASKILNPTLITNQSLKWCLRKYLGIKINKSEKIAISDWFSPFLTDEQINYAIEDVIYLIPLLNELEKQLKEKDLFELTQLCFAHIPTRVILDILGYNDIYKY